MDENQVGEQSMNRKKMVINRRLSGSIFLIILALLVLVSAEACARNHLGTSLSISLADRKVQEGETFPVEVRISTDTPCRGAQCALSFDPALMKCDSVVEGGFFRDWATANGSSTLMIPQSPSIDNTQGRVPTIGIAIMGGGGGGVKGSGVLCTYHFTALADGTAEPTLSDVVVADESGQAILDVKVNN